MRQNAKVMLLHEQNSKINSYTVNFISGYARGPPYIVA